MTKPRPLNIIEFDDREQHHPSGVQLPEWMPRHEFFMLMIAPAGSGKTTLILNIVLRIYIAYFHRIILFSPTIHNDQKWEHLVKHPHLLRKNPHRQKWTVTDSQEEQDTFQDRKESGSDQDEGENSAVTYPDTVRLEAFSEGSQPRHSTKTKRMGKHYLQQWFHQRHQHHRRALSSRKLSSADQVRQIEKKRMTLACTIVKPVAPVMSQQVKEFQHLFGFSNEGATPSPCSARQYDFSSGIHLYLEKPRTHPCTENPFFCRTQPPADPPVEQTETGHKTESRGVKMSLDDMYEEYNEETLNELMKDQDKIMKRLNTSKKPITWADQILWVFDDMVGSGLFHQKRLNAFKRLSVRRRHFCSSIIGVVQAYKEFPKTSRTNANIFILFKIDNEDELEAIYKDFPCGLKWDHWRQVYQYCVQEPYGFMMINTQVKNPQYRLVKNFDQPLMIPSDRTLHDSWLASLKPNSSTTVSASPQSCSTLTSVCHNQRKRGFSSGTSSSSTLCQRKAAFRKK